MAKLQRILSVIPDRQLFAKVEGLLSRTCFELNQVPSGAGALILTGNVRYSLILIQAPLADLALSEFLASIRTLESPCAASSVLILVCGGTDLGLGESLASDCVQVLPAESDATAIYSVASRLLGVAGRRSTRTLVSVQAHMEPGESLMAYQTVNLSESGMLIRGTHLIPVGSEVQIAFSLPEDGNAITGRAEIVRHAGAAGGDVHGMGIRFVELSDDGTQRLRDFVGWRASTTQPPGSANEEPTADHAATDAAS